MIYTKLRPFEVANRLNHLSGSHMVSQVRWFENTNVGFVVYHEMNHNVYLVRIGDDSVQRGDPYVLVDAGSGVDFQYDGDGRLTEVRIGRQKDIEVYT